MSRSTKLEAALNGSRADVTKDVQFGKWGALTAAATPSDLTTNVAATTLARHRQLLNTNEAPEGELILKITFADFLHISTWNFGLSSLWKERASLVSYHAQNKAILFPIRRIPAELLGEIFLWTLPSADGTFGRARFDTKDSPWVLTHISSHRRAVSLSNPSLWSPVVINRSRMAARPLAAVKTQIQRGRTLKIHFFGKHVMDSRPQIEMWQFLAENSWRRWEELFLQLTSDLFPLLAGFRHRLPSLRRFWIKWNGSPSQAAVDSMDCFQMAPRLVDTSIHNADRHIPFLLPAHQLTRYDLHGPLEMHRDMLKLVQNLIEARITIDFENEPWLDPRQPIELRHLQRLYASRAEILNHLRAPALTTMAMYLMYSENSIHLQPFLTPLSPSPPVLRYADIVHAEKERNRKKDAPPAATDQDDWTCGAAATSPRKQEAVHFSYHETPARSQDDPRYANTRIVTLTSTSTSEGAAFGLKVSDEEGLMLSTEEAHLWNVKGAYLIRGKRGVRPRVGLQGEGLNPWAVEEARIQQWRELVRAARDRVPDSEAPRDLNGSDSPVVFALGLAKQRNVPGDAFPPIKYILLSEAVGQIERLALEIRAFEISAVSQTGGLAVWISSDRGRVERRIWVDAYYIQELEKAGTKREEKRVACLAFT
ncbi:hypothetical protein C8R44DRAFT_898813 [Mycena epipterygia]|nr:hypothetical protein C8R44DRAFT_898813 [Mycena epipterygia]